MCAYANNVFLHLTQIFTAGVNVKCYCVRISVVTAAVEAASGAIEAGFTAAAVRSLLVVARRRRHVTLVGYVRSSVNITFVDI